MSPGIVFTFLSVLLWCAPIMVQATLTVVPFNPTTVKIPENSKQLTKLPTSMVDCTSDNPQATCVCFVSPQTIPFEMFQMPSDSDPYIYYYGSQSLIVGNTYVVDLQCKEDNTGPLKSQTLYVDIDPIKKFTIVNYPADSVTIDAKNTKADKVIYTVKYNNPENYAILSTMTQTPNQGLFDIGLGNGQIRTLVDLRYATSSTYKFKVTATDGYNTINDFIVTLNLSPVNTAPSIDNLPTSVTVNEDKGKGFVIIDLSVTDPDKYVNPMNPVCTLTSPSDNPKFKVQNTQITLAYDHALDYEVKTFYQFKCNVFDGYLGSDSLDVLTVFVGDANEPPQWSATEYYCNITEGVAGGPSCSLGATMPDPEGNSFTVTLDNPDFSYDPSSDTMWFAKNYDVDTNKKADLVSVMTATDSAGATSTATVIIHVVDINDNKCVLSSTLLQYHVTESDSVMLLGSFTMTDGDLTSPNNDVYMDVMSVSPSTTSDHITMTRDGQIYYTNLFTTDLSGTHFKTYVRCVDNGSPQLSSTATVDVYYTAVTTTTMTTTTTTTVALTTTTEKDIWAFTEFKVIFGLMIAVIGLLTLVGLAILTAYCIRNICMRPRVPTNPQQVQQYRAPPKRSLPPSEPESFPRTPLTNRRWENIAWHNNEVPGSVPPSHLFHYH